MPRLCVMGRDWMAQNGVAFLDTKRRARFFGAYGYPVRVGVRVRSAGRARRDPRIACFVHGAALYGATPFAARLSALGIPNEAALGYEKAIDASSRRIPA